MKNTSRLYDIIGRSFSGPVIEEKDFDMLVYKEVKRVVKQYDIAIGKDHLVNMDDALADRVWDAALDFLASVGVFHQDTGRIIQFSREEIEMVVRQAPSSVVMGRGTDAVTEAWRSLDDERPPVNTGSPVGTPIPNEYFIPVMRSYIQEPLVDMTTGATVEKVNGFEIRTRTPLEILAAWEEMQSIRTAMQMSGRPGMSYVGVQMSVSELGHISAVGKGDYEEGHTHTFGIISELKANNEIFSKLTHSIMQGGIIDGYANPIYGGLGGGLNGQAVLLCAEMVALSVFFMSVCLGSSPTHPVHFNDTGRELLAAQSVAYCAIARNSRLLTNLTITPVGGPMTKTLLYECIAFSCMSAKSGLTRILGPRSATGVVSGHFSGLEARFNGEVLHAACKISREKADEIAQKALAMYEDDLEKKPFGKPFWEVYDPESITPSKEWLQLYNEVRQEAIAWGLPMDKV